MVMSLGTAAIGYAVYAFLAGGNPGYLDMEAEPETESIQCLTRWPMKGQADTWWSRVHWEDWIDYKFHLDTFLREKACEAPTTKHMTCSNFSINLREMNRGLASPLGSESVGNGHDFLDIYSHMFLILAGLLWFAVNVHDLSLLHIRRRDYILDFPGILENFPSIRRALRLTCIRDSLILACSKGSRLATVALLLLPLVFVWGFLVLLIVVCPLVLFHSCRHPVRMSRFSTFLICIMTCIYGLFLTSHQFYFLRLQEDRPHYAVTWSEAGCVCGCVYPVLSAVCWNLLVIGAGVIFQSALLGFRCLKGLRRSNWASLLSVTFSVPLTTYAVEWTQADGQPIMFRTDKMVQDELAFDPFAMMDEQPDSEFTTVTLKPSPILTSSHRSVRALDGPRARQVLHMDPRQISHVTRTEYVGCCGFPIRTGGIVGRIATSDIYDSVDSLGIEQNVGDDGIVGAASGQSQASKHSEFEIENVKRTEYIGCCGFPIRTGGFQAHIGFSDISDSVDTPGGEQDVGDDEIVKTVSGQSLASKHSEFIRLCQVMPKARALHANRDRARAHTGPARIGGEALLERQPHDRPSCDRYVESEALTTATHATVALPCAEVSRASINGAGNQGDDNYVSL